MKKLKQNNKKAIVLVVTILIVALFGSGAIAFRGINTKPNADASLTYPSDIDSDNIVGPADLSILLSRWGTSDILADVIKDGVVNGADLSLLLSKWGPVSITSSPSGMPMPIGDITSGGHTWRQVFAEDFTKDAPLGSWASECDAGKTVYTGTNGTMWRAYPKCYLDTYQKRPYRSDAVLSVQGGMLDFWLHTVDGKPAGANPSPVMPDGTTYLTYGRYEARVRQTTANLSDYHQAWLLWPKIDADWQCAESDFPESKMSSTSSNAYHHYGCSGSQDSYYKTIDKTQWHTYTQEWMPGKRNYYVDGVLIGSSTNTVYDKLQRWQLQTETNTSCDTTNSCTQDGHLQVDWAIVYSY